MTKFWMEDIMVLINSDSIFNFMPSKSFDSNEKLNSIMRFGIYYSIIAYALTRKEYVFIVPFIIMLVTIFIFKNGNTQTMAPSKTKKMDTSCTNPTKNNPFMNLNQYDIGEGKPAACTSYDNNKIENKINKIFTDGLYLDQSGIYSNNNSQNRFYTTPNTQSSNEQKTLGEWLYKTPKSCKEGNNIQCSNNLPDRMNRVKIDSPL